MHHKDLVPPKRGNGGPIATLALLAFLYAGLGAGAEATYQLVRQNKPDPTPWVQYDVVSFVDEDGSVFHTDVAIDATHPLYPY